MGNTMKNFEKKRRKQRKEYYREMQRLVHNTLMARYPIPNEFKEKENEIFDMMNKDF